MLNANTLICSGITTDFPDSSPDDNCLVALFGTVHFALALFLSLVEWKEMLPHLFYCTYPHRHRFATVTG